MRTPEERAHDVECGIAGFELVQTGDLINGDHSLATAGCGRLNEGGPGTAKGVVVGQTAALVVTSARNGAVVMGKATLSGNRMHWKPLQEIKPGEPKGDPPPMLGEATLYRKK